VGKKPKEKKESRFSAHGFSRGGGESKKKKEEKVSVPGLDGGREKRKGRKVRPQDFGRVFLILNIRHSFQEKGGTARKRKKKGKKIRQSNVAPSYRNARWGRGEKKEKGRSPRNSLTELLGRGEREIRGEGKRVLLGE